MRILVVTPNTPGLASEDLISYLMTSEHVVDVMSHPVAPVSKRETTFVARTSPDGESTIVRRRRLVPLTYRTDVSLTQRIIRDRFDARQLVPYDWVICLSPHLALAGLRLRKAGLVKGVVYWALDYYPKRYGSGGVVGTSGLKALAGLAAEKMYRHLESTVVREVDMRWVVTEELPEGWRLGGYTWPSSSSATRVVPHAVSSIRFPLRFEERELAIGLVWTGMIRPEFGFNLLLSAWPRLVELFPRLVLHLTSRSGISSNYKEILGKPPFERIKYLGFLEHKIELDSLIANSGVGLAPYLPGSYKQYSDGARIKSYAACGIPVVTTPYIGSTNVVKRFGAGFVIEPTVSNLVDSVHSLLSDAQLNDDCSSGAYALAQSCRADLVFAGALSAL